MRKIRLATESDHDAIWRILKPVIRAGETYTLPRGMPRKEAVDYWTSGEKTTFVMESNSGVLGTYYIKPNQLGGGDHICNCGYISDPDARGQGVATFMCEHSLNYAIEQGFRGMQYNFVVSTNTGAIRLWEKFGFSIVGTLPNAFSHPSDGFVDAHVMFKSLATDQ